MTVPRPPKQCKFAIDGKSFEIDLSKSNANELRRALKPYVERGRSARRTTGTRKPAGRTSRRPEGYDRTEVRAWAKANRIKVASRGRISNDIVEKWRKATSK